MSTTDDYDVAGYVRPFHAHPGRWSGGHAHPGGDEPHSHMTAAEAKAAGGRRSRRPPFRPDDRQAAALEVVARAGRGSKPSAVREAVAAGIPLRSVAAAAGVSHDTVRRWAAPVCDDCHMRHEAGRCLTEPF